MDIIDCARKNIKKYRKLERMTQKEFADRLQVKHSTVSLWETGKNPIKLSRLDQICQLLNLTVEDLVFDENKATIALCNEDGGDKNVLIHNLRSRPEIRDLYDVSIDCEPKDVMVVTSVLHDLS